jgi:hypothetical protein
MAKKKRGPGRPKHTDDPPVKLMTTIPKSIDRLLTVLKERTGRPRSELIAEALRSYAKHAR